MKGFVDAATPVPVDVLLAGITSTSQAVALPLFVQDKLAVVGVIVPTVKTLGSKHCCTTFTSSINHLSPVVEVEGCVFILTNAI